MSCYMTVNSTNSHLPGIQITIFKYNTYLACMAILSLIMHYY